MESAFSLIFLAVFFGIFYFMIIRPQKKRQQNHQTLVHALKRGDNVVSAGGICGVVKKVDKETVIVDTEGVALKIQKNSIVERN